MNDHLHEWQALQLNELRQREMLRKAEERRQLDKSRRELPRRRFRRQR